MMNPKDILFSLPTLSDGLPPLDESAPPTVPADATRLHEDDWRQIEFVLNSDRQAVDRELAELARFREEKRSGPGWTDIYVRKARPDAIEPRRARLADLLRTVKQRTPSALYIDSGGHPARVQGGFAIKLKGVVLYGNTRDGDDVIVALGLLPDSTGAIDADRQTIADLCHSMDAFVVDWYGNRIVKL
jgi:hypothetical protein